MNTKFQQINKKATQIQKSGGKRTVTRSVFKITRSEAVKQAAKEIARKSPKKTKSRAKVMTEDQYLRSKGVDPMWTVEPGLHKGFAGGSQKQHQRYVKIWEERENKAFAERSRLRKEYQDKVKAGELRPPTIVEGLQERLKKNPNDEQAKRLLRKRGYNV